MRDMTVYTTHLKCPNCGKDIPFIMHTLIDTAKDPNALNQLLSSEYFTYSCSKCNVVDYVTYSFMYHDGTNKLLIACADSEKDYVEMKDTLSGERQNTELDQVLSKWLSTCEVRLVREVHETQEKVLISYLKLDDRVIELIKYQIKKELGKDAELLFNTEEGDFVISVYTSKGLVNKIVVTKDKIDEIQQTYKDVLENDTSIEINEYWAKQIIEKE